jgi:alpha,alpha-trehalase
LSQRELAWWTANRMLSVASPRTNASHTLAHYAVTNSAPRPESYLQDYTTANDPTLPALSEAQKEDLYSQLASGAETGWDYSSRWMADPSLPSTEALRSLRTKSIVPVCLNSILCLWSSSLRSSIR